MTPRIRKLFSFPIDADLALALKQVKAERGIPEAEQIRRGIALWLQSIGQPVPSTDPSPDFLRPTSVSQRKRLALARFHATLLAAAPLEVAACIVPVELGPALGGGRRFGEITETQLRRLGELNAAVGKEIADLARLQNKVRREG